MSTSLAGNVQAPSVESLTLPVPISKRHVEFPQIRIPSSSLFFYLIISLTCTCISCLTFFSSVALGRHWLTWSKTHNPEDGSSRNPSVPLPSAGGEYASAALAGGFFSISCQLIYGIMWFFENHAIYSAKPNSNAGFSTTQRMSWVRLRLRQLKEPVVWLALNLLLGGPAFMVLSGLILKRASTFPGIEIKDLVLQCLVGAPMVLFGLFILGFFLRYCVLCVV
ncbi:hypothetical protein DL96DRAFT_1581379 [Flagelloscypha sp. PMI_526]|nr:hypothetical protein DL96DRAFT_1581379 [Flagelloscypha sp. PMI_526]